jgi:hypothetical protein
MKPIAPMFDYLLLGLDHYIYSFIYFWQSEQITGRASTRDIQETSKKNTSMNIDAFKIRMDRCLSSLTRLSLELPDSYSTREKRENSTNDKEEISLTLNDHR